MRDNFTIDQIYLFYEKCRKDELDKQRTNAIILAQSFIFATPAYDKSDARKKSQNWKKFLESLDWDKLVNKTGKSLKGMSVGNLKGMLFGLKIPIEVKKEEGESK